MNRKVLIGLLGIAGIWITAGLALPFVNVLHALEPEQLLVARGFITAALAFILLRGKVVCADRMTYLIAPAMALASLGLFRGIRAWGAGPTLVVIAASPVINFLFALRERRNVSPVTFGAFALLVAGVFLALQPAEFSAAGCAWSSFAALAAGLLYETFARSSEKVSLLTKCFWGCLGMGVLNLGVSLVLGWSWTPLENGMFLAQVTVFALVGGFLYWMANLLAFKKGYLPTEIAAVLAQGETPAVILMAGLILGEAFTVTQWLGVAVALVGASSLVIWLQHKDRAPATFHSTASH